MCYWGLGYMYVQKNIQMGSMLCGISISSMRQLKMKKMCIERTRQFSKHLKVFIQGFIEFYQLNQWLD